MQVRVLAEQIGAEVVGGDAEFFSVSTDTRTLKSGDLFVALQGPNFDGHDYVKQAFAQGAVAAMVTRQVEAERPLVMVKDTLRGLGALGRIWQQQFAVSKIAITGSCGKTTLKEMVSAILAQVGPTLATRGNLNNEIGVPLTLCRLSAEHRFAVVECGANHLGEIAYTAGLVQPQVAIVNNVAPAHLEGFGSIDNVASAKGEIYGSLDAGGVAVINLDDAFANRFLEQTAFCRRMTFSLRNPHADVHAETVTTTASGQYDIQVKLPSGSLTVLLPLLGTHNARNAVAACAIAEALGVSHDAMIKGLQTVRPTVGRLFPVVDIPGFRVIDDAYNANPASIRAAIDVLAEQGGATCLVLGGMGELGGESDSLHESVGRYAAEKGIARVYSLGPNATFYRHGYESQKPEGGVFTIAQSHREIALALAAQEKDKLILIKGSRTTAMENVIAILREQSQLHEEHR